MFDASQGSNSDVRDESDTKHFDTCLNIHEVKTQAEDSDGEHWDEEHDADSDQHHVGSPHPRHPPLLDNTSECFWVVLLPQKHPGVGVESWDDTKRDDELNEADENVVDKVEVIIPILGY